MKRQRRVNFIIIEIIVVGWNTSIMHWNLLTTIMVRTIIHHTIPLYINSGTTMVPYNRLNAIYVFALAFAAAGVTQLRGADNSFVFFPTRPVVMNVHTLSRKNSPNQWSFGGLCLDYIYSHQEVWCAHLFHLSLDQPTEDPLHPFVRPSVRPGERKKHPAKENAK